MSPVPHPFLCFSPTTTGLHAAPPALLLPLPQTDLRFVLTKTPLLLDEMMKIAVLPRPPLGYGWMVSTSYDLRCTARHTCLHAAPSGPTPL